LSLLVPRSVSGSAISGRVGVINADVGKNPMLQKGWPN
jgi:hypothetical protein